MSAVAEFVIRLTQQSCSECGMTFAMPAGLHARLVRDKGSFWCPAGHNRVFTGETELERMKRALEFEKQRREAAERTRDSAQHAAAIIRGKHEALKKRIKHGVCPCCHRSFVQLQRHMTTKHPDYEAKGDK